MRLLTHCTPSHAILPPCERSTIMSAQQRCIFCATWLLFAAEASVLKGDTSRAVLQKVVIFNNAGRFFDIVALPLEEALRELGLHAPVVTTEGDIPSDSVAIVFTSHGGTGSIRRYISYNWEQLTRDWPESFFNTLRGAVAVWDYSLKNVEILAQHGIRAHHVPFGYSKLNEVAGLTLPLSAHNRSLDFVLDAWWTGSRVEKLSGLKAYYDEHGLVARLDFSDECYGSCRVHRAARAKFGLNFHAGPDYKIFEQHRVVPLIMAGVWVVSEPSLDHWADETYSEFVTFIPSATNVTAYLSHMAQTTTDAEWGIIMTHRFQKFRATMQYSRFVREAFGSLIAENEPESSLNRSYYSI